MPVNFIENRTYDEIQVGDSATLTRTLRPEDIQLFAIMSGDVNPAHVDPEYAHSSMFHEVIAHGMWGGALISTVLGTEFPGPGTIYISQTLRFSRPVKVGCTPPRGLGSVCPNGITTIIGLALPSAIRLSRMTLASPVVAHELSVPPLP